MAGILVLRATYPQILHAALYFASFVLPLHLKK
jgi:hypothetical protein